MLLQDVELFTCKLALADATIYTMARTFKRLRKLNIGFCGVADNALVEVAKSVCCTAASLCSLCAADLTSRFLALCVFLRQCPLLEVLDVFESVKITDNSLCEVARRCPELREIWFERCSLITDRTVDEVARYCKKLEVWDSYYCNKISSAAVCRLVASCPTIKRLQIGGSRAVTNALLFAVAR